jgi:hypothetical protein
MIVEFAEYKKRVIRSPFTILQKLFNFLKKKGLNVKYDEGGPEYYNSEHILGDDFLIYLKNEEIEIEQMFNIGTNEKGIRCGSWKAIYFQVDQFNEIYEFVKDIAEINDMEIDIKKYNL